MVRGVRDNTLHEECIRLRVEERLSYREILDRTGVGKANLSGWLRNHPLSPQEKAEKRRLAYKGRAIRKAASIVEPSHEDRIFLGKAAEHGFIAKCLLHGLECYVPVSGGGRVDVIVGGGLARCQVKEITDRVSRRNPPSLTLKKVSHVGSRITSYRYSEADVDFLVGVELPSLRVFVAPISDLASYKRAVSISVLEERGYENAFDRITSFGREVLR